MDYKFVYTRTTVQQLISYTFLVYWYAENKDYSIIHRYS